MTGAEYVQLSPAEAKGLSKARQAGIEGLAFVSSHATQKLETKRCQHSVTSSARS